MKRVVHGKETKRGDQPICDCSKPAAECYTTLLNLMGDEMLMGSSKEGKGSGSLRCGLDHFKRPQTSDNIHNLHDIHCHMPSKHGFPSGSPFAKVVAENKWYTTIKLGKDENNEVVREKAHVLVTAARFGVPTTLYDKSLPKKDVHQALHLPKCPHRKGGCNNPLHMRWDFPKANKVDQSLRKARSGGIRVGRPRVGRPRVPSPPIGGEEPMGVVVGKRVTRSRAKAQAL